MELLLFMLMIQLSGVLSENEEVFKAKLYTGEEMKSLLTGTKLSNDLKTDCSSVGGILVHREGDDTYVLLASELKGKDGKWGDGKRHEGKWCELGGQGKGGESLLETLKREVNEESGRKIALTDSYILENSQLFYHNRKEKAKDKVTEVTRHEAYVFIHTDTLYDTGVLERAAEAATGDAKEKEKFYWISICSLLKADQNILRNEKERQDKKLPENEAMRNEIEVEVLHQGKKIPKKITLRYWFAVNMLNEHFRNALGAQITPSNGTHANQKSWMSQCSVM